MNRSLFGNVVTFNDKIDLIRIRTRRLIRTQDHILEVNEVRGN